MGLKPVCESSAEMVNLEGWRACDITDLCSFQRGFDITEATRTAGDVPVYSSSGLSYFHSEAKLDPPAVVTGRKGILGKVFYIEERCWPHDTTLWVKDFRGNDPSFVYWFLVYFRLERFDASTSVPTLNRNNLVNIPILLPPLAEQRAIAAALSDVDALLAKLDALLAKKRDLKQAAMQQLLTGKQRLSGFTDQWEVRLLGEVFHVTAGGDFDPSKSSVLQDETYCYPIYSNAISERGLYGYCSYPEHEAGSITVTARGTLGHSTFRDHSFTAIGRVLVLKPNYPVDGQFFSEFINHNVDFAVESTGVPQLTAPQVSKYLLQVPSLPEQRAIAVVLSDMDAELAALEARRDKTRALKQGMMQELLTGSIRLPVPAEAEAVARS